MNRLAPILLSFLALVACDAVDPDPDAVPERGEAGKADAFGSCEDAYGEQSRTALCWCDEGCAEFGDCCSDALEVCAVVEAPPCLGPLFQPCPDDTMMCVDDPSDDCDQATSLEFCYGVCVGEDGPFCGGFANIPCPNAMTCVDDPFDECDPDDGGADCRGVCV